MQCPEFEERLQLAVDFRRDPSDDAELDDHAAVCADCSAKREWFAALARMTEAFRPSPVGVSASEYDRSRLIRKTLPLVACGDASDVAGAVLATPVEPDVVLATPAEPAPRRSRWLLAGSGLAVAAGFAIFVTLAFLPWSPPAGNDEVALHVPTSTAGAEGSAAETDVPVIALNPDVVAVAPAGEAQGDADRALSLERLRASLTSSLPSEPAMTGSLRPIATSFGVAWDAVRSALPNGRSEAGPGQDQAEVGGFHAGVTA